ncbi:MAG: prefoldin subunit alpha [Nanoarchaeota archaeon]
MSEDEDKKRIMQEKYLEFQILKQHIDEVQQQRSMLVQNNKEAKRAQETLATIGETKINDDMFAQIGGGIFAKTALIDNENILMDVGADIFISKSVAEAKGYIGEKIKELENVIENVDQALNKAQNQLHAIQEELLSLNKESE